MSQFEPSQPGGATTLPAAVLWDMDGTLVDTEPYWAEAEFALVREHGGHWSTEHALALVGNDLLTSGRYIARHGGVRLPPERIVERLLDHVVTRVAQEPAWRPGGLRLLSELRTAGVPCALVTMSYRRLAEAVVDQLPPASFEVVVTGDEVTHGKPHPEPYLLAARRLGVRPQACVAIEDSPTGLASAQAAGVPVFAVPHVVPIEPAPGRLVVNSLELLTLDILARAVLDPSHGDPQPQSATFVSDTPACR